ncbi:MAG: restriction endonuclease, partial [Chitinophagaceae bacterium]
EEVLSQLQKISPGAFERLCQRLLRELGFQNVEVTGQKNDGGIDGKGIIRIGGVLSFHVIFQAKRYRGSVSPSIVRDFRGAMVGRADKGLIITTGSFTREAKREATRDGATPVDLIDGNDLAEKLKELNMGIETELVEKVNIKKDWFKTL